MRMGGCSPNYSPPIVLAGYAFCFLHGVHYLALYYWYCTIVSILFFVSRSLQEQRSQDRGCFRCRLKCRFLELNVPSLFFSFTF